MGYIDVFIPLLFGFLLVLSPGLFIRAESSAYQKKIQRIKRIGYVLIGVGVIYLLIKVFSTV